MQLNPAAHTQEAFRALKLNDTERTVRFDSGVTFDPQNTATPVNPTLIKSWTP